MLLTSSLLQSPKYSYTGILLSNIKSALYLHSSSVYGPLIKSLAVSAIWGNLSLCKRYQLQSQSGSEVSVTLTRGESQ